jgi:hypothetical protein
MRKISSMDRAGATTKTSLFASKVISFAPCLGSFTPLGASNKLTIVQCSGCGAAIGVLDPAAGLQIDALKNHVAAIDERLNRIAKALQD